MQINIRTSNGGTMPYGKGTYGSKKGRPAAKSKLSSKQKTLPDSLKKKIMAKMKKKK
tara:strand:+ start:1724 stop:1894 length:171 start_codon:yes stop_codon:yes gene_type:complete